MKKKPIKVGMKPSHPGAFIKTEIVDELGLSVTKAAELLGVRRATFSDLLHEKAGLSPEMALRLEKAFGRSAESWLIMQDNFDLWQARQSANLDTVKSIYQPTH